MIKKNYIPTIDISFILKYGLEKKKSKKILQKIEHACTKVGFFQIVGHNIRQSDIKKITKVGNLFFNLKSEKKLIFKRKVNARVYAKCLHKIRKNFKKSGETL